MLLQLLLQRTLLNWRALRWVLLLLRCMFCLVAMIHGILDVAAECGVYIKYLLSKESSMLSYFGLRNSSSTINSAAAVQAACLCGILCVCTVQRKLVYTG
jgi:hypothetical protein